MWDFEGFFVDIEFWFGMLVVFLSEDYYYEVLFVHVRCFSVMGWFCVWDFLLFG